jgi:hypothetical protein
MQAEQVTSKMILLILGAGLFAAGCGAHDVRQYRNDLETVKSVASPGRNIHSVKADLERSGYEVSEPYDPTKLGKVIWMNVHVGSQLGLVDGVLYASGLPDKGPPSSIVVKADPEGKVIGVVGNKE